MCPADSVTRLKKIQKKGTPWIIRVGYCARENPGTPTFEVPDVMGPGWVLRNVQARTAVLAKPTRVAKLIRTSKNFSTLCILPMMSFASDCYHMVVLSLTA